MNTGNWHSNPQPTVGYHDCINSIVMHIQDTAPVIIPDFRSSDGIYITSDYGGEDSYNNTLTYSFLFTNREYFQTWEPSWRQWRETNLANQQPIVKYSRIRGHSPQARSFLQLADSLPGLLMTFAIDKELRSIMRTGAPYKIDELEKEPEIFWKPEQVETIWRLCSLIGLVLGSITREDQQVHWVTDRIPYIEDGPRKDYLKRKFMGITGAFREHRLSGPGFETMEIDKGECYFKDLAQICDYASGATAEYFSARKTQRIDSRILIVEGQPKNLSSKCAQITDWLRDHTQSLKRLTFHLFEDQQLQKPYQVRLLDACFPEAIRSCVYGALISSGVRVPLEP